MKSAGNEGVVHDRLQVLHVHVFLAAPLGARHVAKSGADQHQGGVAIGECPHHTEPRDGSRGLSTQSYCLYACAPNVRWEGQVWVRQKVLFQIGKSLPLRTSKKKVLSFLPPVPPKHSRKSAQRWLPAFILNGKHHCCQRDRSESSQYRFRPSRRFLSFITFSQASLLIA